MPSTATESTVNPLSNLFRELSSRLDFARLIDQRGRMLKVETALPQLALVPERLVHREAVGQPFELVLDALGTSRHFELKRLIGEQISVRLLQPTGLYRPWHGYVFEAAQLGADGGLARYRLVMRPWLSLLAQRRDCFAFQDKTATEIIEDIFRDYSQANFELQVSEPLRRRSLCIQYRESDLEFVSRLLAEEGLGYHFHHLDGEAAASADASGQARHVLVITDRLAARPQLGDIRFATQHASASRDAVTAFAAQRRLGPNAVKLGAWNYRALAGTAAEDRSALDLGDIPALEVYDGSGAYRYQDAAHAERAAALALAALELDYKRFEGQGSARQLVAGAGFALIDHPLYGANRTAFDEPGALLASHRRDDNAFTLLAVEHHASNNLGAEAAQLLGSTELERGTYKNHFHCVPAAAAVVPRFIRKPTAPGLQTALVVAVQGEPLTTDRDHRIKLQFPWQRGQAPLAGGLPHDETSPDAAGNAPGNERSLTWVRVNLPSAGANWGTVFTPRVGAEVAVEFVEGDIDRPLVLGVLYNGADPPPFAAGVDSGVNHPGVISGLHSTGLDGGGFNQWVLDDATGQLRMRLMASSTTAQLGLGHLIQQSPSSAQRGSWRGAGFEAATFGWGSLRAGRGMLVTTTVRGGTYGSAHSTQLDAAEAVAQMKAARSLGQALHAAATAGTALGLHSHDAGQAWDSAIRASDVTQDGHHPGPVNGQPATKTTADGRSPAGPVEALDKPLLLLDSPTTVAWASEAGIAAFSGQSASLLAHGDIHQAAAHTWASASGQTTSLFTHEGGVKAFAANGPVTLRAHTDALQILADKEVTVISVNDEIHIQANTRIEVVGGQSSMVLEGGNVTFTCPGHFQVKSATHNFLGAGSVPASLPALPVGRATEPPNWIEVTFHDDALKPLAGYPYRVVFAGGTQLQGVLDGRGYARHEGVPNEAAEVFFGDSPKPASLQPVQAVSVTDEALAADLQRLGLSAHTDLQALVERESGRSA